MKKQHNRGLVKTVIVIIIALLLLKYVFGLTLNDIIGSQLARDIWSIITQLWDLLWQAIVILFEFVKDLVFKLKNIVTSAS